MRFIRKGGRVIPIKDGPHQPKQDKLKTANRLSYAALATLPAEIGLHELADSHLKKSHKFGAASMIWARQAKNAVTPTGIFGYNNAAETAREFAKKSLSHGATAMTLRRVAVGTTTAGLGLAAAALVVRKKATGSWTGFRKDKKK